MLVSIGKPLMYIISMNSVTSWFCMVNSGGISTTSGLTSFNFFQKLDYKLSTKQCKNVLTLRLYNVEHNYVFFKIHLYTFLFTVSLWVAANTCLSQISTKLDVLTLILVHKVWLFCLSLAIVSALS